MISVTDSLFDQIQKGLRGENLGLDVGLPRMTQHICGLTDATIVTIMGTSGSGKTSIGLYCYLYKPVYQQIMESKDDIRVLYYSLELSKEVLLAKILCIYLYETYKIIISFNDLFGRIKNNQKLDGYVLSKIEESKPFLMEFESRILVKEAPLNEKILAADLIMFSDLPQRYRMVFIDHVGLVSGNNIKKVIDDCMQVLIEFKIKTGITAILMQQANRTGTSMDRRKADMTDLQLSDAKDTGDTVNGSDIVLAINNPFRNKQDNHWGYKIVDSGQPVLGDMYRGLECIKNRFGRSEVKVGINFFGLNGLVREIPEPKLILDYNLYRKIY